MSDPHLQALLHWMQDAMMAGPAAVPRAGAEALVRGSNRLTASQRLGIYAQGYRLRLLECLEGEYPILKRLVGPDLFRLFGQAYIEACPSQSYTLYDFGAGFAEYLDRVRPRGDGTPQTPEAIPATLARVERARAEVYRARGLEGRAPAGGEGGFLFDLLALAGNGGWCRPDSVRLLALPFDVTATLAAAEQEEAPVLPAPTPSFLAVARRHYRVECHRLEPAAFDFLSRLPAEGQGTGPAPHVPDLAAWLPQARALGLVVEG